MWSLILKLFLVGLVIVLYLRLRALARHLADLANAVEDGKTFLLERSNRLLVSSNFEQLVKACNHLVTSSARVNRAQHDYLRQIEATLGNIREAVLIVDSDNYVLMANSVVRQFLGREQPLLGRRLESLIQSSVFHDYVRSVKEGENRAYEELEFRRGRESFWFEVSGARLPDKDSERGVLTLFVLHDITARKRLENLRTEFVANVSHELRTPVTIIKGFTETLLEDHHFLSQDERARFLDKIQRNVIRLHSLLEDLLTLSRLEAAVDPLHLEEYSMANFAREICDNFRTRLDDSLSLSVIAEPGDDIVRLDPMRITQVLENLLDNATKHARGATALIVRITPLDSGVQCVVEDNGCGIPEADLPHIFERFYRVDKGRSRDRGGTGLGLSIVKHIIQQHGGSIVAHSVVGQGSKLGFLLLRQGPRTNRPDVGFASATPDQLRT